MPTEPDNIPERVLDAFEDAYFDPAKPSGFRPAIAAALDSLFTDEPVVFTVLDDRGNHTTIPVRPSEVLAAVLLKEQA